MARPASLALPLVLGAALALAGCLSKADEHRVRANAFLRGNDAASALKECDEGLALRKDDLPLLILRGKALFELDRLDDARAAYRHALDVGAGEPKRSLAEAHLGLAMIASRKHDWAGARHEFGALVEGNEQDGSSQMNLARACLELKDLKCAVEHGELAKRLRPGDEKVLFTLGTIYLAADRTADASTTFEEICTAVPGTASCPYGRALVAAKKGDKDAALAALDEAVKKKLPNPDRIAEDPGFSSLKGDARFAAIAARAAESVKK
ncbi:MAG TPA: tetratricopeptide repeat protein [Minicystis sp.]|nr:tetratricopeptide repeat protein [Minicystis sp.]